MGGGGEKGTEGHKSKTGGQPAHTREGRLGCVFDQTTRDAEGFAMRDPNSITSTGALETAEEFGSRIHVNAWKGGWRRSERSVVVGWPQKRDRLKQSGRFRTVAGRNSRRRESRRAAY